MTNTIRQEDTVNLDGPIAQDVVDFVAAQNISLKANELSRIRELFGRNPTLVELHIFNIMWSEHCSYKSSRPVLKTLPTEAPHVVLGPGEDAGVIRFYEKDGRSRCLVLAHESHNHPSQVLPVEGAATGIGGIVRDVYCMGADVIGVLDPLRFGDPDGVNARRTRDIVRGVVDGISQYGNALGVPNWGGETCFDASFDDNCLVNVVAIGTVDEDRMVRSRAPREAQHETYDIILIGKPTDASGFGGAAFASERLTGEEERQEAVQVPDPFLKRVLAEATKVVLREARDNNIPIGFKDLGAGGIACAVSEMAQAGGVGGHLDLDKVSKASQALLPEVIACSETQERYAMFVPRSFTDTVLRIYNEDFDLPHIYTGAGAFVIGETSPDKRFKLAREGVMVCDADVDVITTGIEYDREKRERPRTSAAVPAKAPDTKTALLELLASYNIADKSILFQHYDSEVQGRAVLRPGEADAAVALFDRDNVVGVATGLGSNSRVGLVDPYLGGVWSVVEAVRNVACVGGLALAATDCLNFGDPESPDVFWDFTEAVRGIGDACRGLKIHDSGDHGVPIVSGNVSFYNQSGDGEPIAPTPIVACAGRVDDVSICRNLGLKKSGSRVVLLGALHENLGGSEFNRVFGGEGGRAPEPDLDNESRMIKALLEAQRERGVLAAHDISHGGLMVTLAEMVMGSAPSRIGCRVELAVGGAAMLFGEYGGIVVEVADTAWSEVEAILDKHGAEWQLLGETTDGGELRVDAAGESATATFDEMFAAQNTNGKCNALFA